MTFGEKLQSLRKAKGWTQEELASQISISRQALSKWELGTAIPDTENVLQISKIFGVSTDYLLNDDYEGDTDVPEEPEETASNEEEVKKSSSLTMISAIGIVVVGIAAVFTTDSAMYIKVVATICILIVAAYAAYVSNCKNHKDH